jgi:hypothetical protein
MQEWLGNQARRVGARLAFRKAGGKSVSSDIIVDRSKLNDRRYVRSK